MRRGADVRGDRRFAVRIAASDAALATCVYPAASLWARFRGLMGRPGLTPGEGLWLPSDVSIHMLFMRFPIDAVFLARSDAGDADAWRVVAIRERLRPWTGVVWYVRGARGCLELEAGAAARVRLRAGDVVRFEPLPADGALAEAPGAG
ncbi:MAG: DUF192 domain-containing protein [Candidatus Limnocylindrales bacterium]